MSIYQPDCVKIVSAIVYDTVVGSARVKYLRFQALQEVQHPYFVSSLVPHFFFGEFSM